MMDTVELRALHVVLACSREPVAVGALADTGVWRPSLLLAALDPLASSDLVTLSPNRDLITWIGDADSAICTAGAESLALLTSVPWFLELLVSNARLAAQERRFATAEVLYRGLASIPLACRTQLAGGEDTWVDLIAEAIRLFRSAWLLNPAILDAAISRAEERGNLRAQAVVLAARAVIALSEGVERAQPFFERSQEAAEAADDAEIRAEVHIYSAVALVLSGRPGQGVAAFEALVGDIQGDLLGVDSRRLLDLNSALPASGLSMLAQGYSLVGNSARAVDLMRGALDLGQQLGNRALQAQSQAMLGVAFMAAGDRIAAARFAEAAAPWFRSAVSPYAWACSLTLAWACAPDATERARTLLSEAIPTWSQTGRYWIGGSRTLELLELIQDSNTEPLEGLSVDSEVARHINAPQPLLAGIAHRWAAKKATSLHEAREHLELALPLLREAGGGPELRTALEDAAEIARKQNDESARQRWSAELDQPQAPNPRATDVMRLARGILELGRLGSLMPRKGAWGEVAARLCRDFGAERCALYLFDENGVPRLLAARAFPPWREALLARICTRPVVSPCFEAALLTQTNAPVGQLVLVPFDDGERHRGVVAFENRELTPRFGPADVSLVASLGLQMGILLANVGLWQTLEELRQRLEQENQYYRTANSTTAPSSGAIVGESPAMRGVLDWVRRAAPSMTPVLVTGETGVGKELVSREVHLSSPRRDGPFIAVHVASLSPGLVSSALFGHERGAFTGATQQSKGRFELAHGGTLFLDEVGELQPEDQVRLLRVLQEGTFERVGGTRPIRSNFRLVAATNRDLAAEVRANRFREDLYFRLAAFPIAVPPLRERKEEIPTLSLLFLEQVCRKLGLTYDGISKRDMTKLCTYHWPGNVRELQHVIERAALLSDPPKLRIPALESPGLHMPVTPPESVEPTCESWISLEEADRRYIRRVLHHVQGRVSGPGSAAEILGLKPSTLHFWIDRLNLREDLASARASEPSKRRDRR